MNLANWRSNIKFTNQNKENQNTSNIINHAASHDQPYNQKCSIYDQLIESDIESDEIAEKISNLILNKKKSMLRQTISGLLIVRRQRDKIISVRQIMDEHLLFKILKKWKRNVTDQQKKRLQAECHIQKQKYLSKRAYFKQWKQLVANRKNAEQHFKRTVFETLKMVCTNQLQAIIEVGRSDQEEYNWKSLEKDTIQNQVESTNKKRKAENYYYFRFISRYFQAMINRRQSLREENLRYQRYKLAFLFNKHKLYTKSFKSMLMLMDTSISHCEN